MEKNLVVLNDIDCKSVTVITKSKNERRFYVKKLDIEIPSRIGFECFLTFHALFQFAVSKEEINNNDFKLNFINAISSYQANDVLSKVISSVLIVNFVECNLEDGTFKVEATFENAGERQELLSFIDKMAAERIQKTKLAITKPRAETSYRIYACGKIIHQDDFGEADNSQPYYDDYETIIIPDELIDYIVG
jgi:hypothetical protein